MQTLFTKRMDFNSVELEVSCKFEVLKLKTCLLYHEKLLLQKFNDMITQVLKELFSASDIMEALRIINRNNITYPIAFFNSSHDVKPTLKWENGN